ncbi:putative disease resistance protein RGA1 [Typha angustifolia]|uniref:putative disease resistance protein RGA1 n=1 Tax=Typha angustifolia TaxID=59011 RepID=UPI003C2AFF33
MAELALASAILEPVIANLGSELWKNLGLFWGFDEDLLKLKKTLEKINTVLVAANHKSITDPGIRDWLRELKAAAYDVDDLLDDFQVEALRRGSHRFVTGKVKDFFSANNQVAFRYVMAKRVKKINERLNEIEVEKNRFQFPVVEISANTTTVSCLERETFSIVDENNDCNKLYGRDDDKEKILKFLLEMDNDKQLYSWFGRNRKNYSSSCGFIK